MEHAVYLIGQLPISSVDENLKEQLPRMEPHRLEKRGPSYEGLIPQIFCVSDEYKKGESNAAFGAATSTQYMRIPHYARHYDVAMQARSD